MQQVLLTRAPVGNHVSFTYRNEGQEAVTRVTLKAVDDGMEPLLQAMGWWDAYGFQESWGQDPAAYDLRKPPEYRVLPGGFGYIRVYHVIPEADDPDFAGIMGQAVTEFNAQGVSGVIIDVRGNPGGQDTLVTAMMAHFVPQERFYEAMYFHNWLTGLSTLDLSIPLRIEPAEARFDGPLLVLVDQHTRSSGEGFALVAKQLPQGKVLGVYGTHGSFGMCCGWIHMPEGLEVGYPTGQSRDENGQVQVDADAALIGGVRPDVRVPLTWETVQAMFLEGEDVVLKYALVALNEE
jgi:carboxyl-terminal processing protease